MKNLTIAFLLVFFLSTPAMGRNYRVKRVIEAHVIEVDYQGKTERVRMLNVTPPGPDQSELGKRARNYTRSRLNNKKVDLEFQSGLRRAGFNHLLAYVIVNGRNFSLDLVRNGWARYDDTTYGSSIKYHTDFVIAERFAKSARMGVWAGNGR